MEKVAQPELPRVTAWQNVCGLVFLAEARGLEKQRKCGAHVCCINQRLITFQMDMFLPLSHLISF